MGGSKSTKSEVPQFVKDAGEFGVDRGMQLAEMGYMPYFGPDVAALSPMQYAGMQNTNSAASAFGMAAPGGGGGQGGMDPMTGLPAPTNYGGFNAYSSGPMYQGAIDQLQSKRPGQFSAYEAMFVDPQTGQMAVEQPQQQESGSLWDMSPGKSHGAWNNDRTMRWDQTTRTWVRPGVWAGNQH